MTEKMELIGMLDSPFVRRVAITLNFMQIPYHHRALSVFRDLDAFRVLNPLVKAPTLLLPTGETLVESSLILDYLEKRSPISLMPESLEDYRDVVAIIGTALIANEKAVQVYYERNIRAHQHMSEDWLIRVIEQLRAALIALEQRIPDDRATLVGNSITQADITVAVAWGFCTLVCGDEVTATQFPKLAAFAAQNELLPEFKASPIKVNSD